MKSFSRSMQAFNSFNYIPNIAFILFYCVLYFAPTPTPTPTPTTTFTPLPLSLPSRILNGKEESQYKGINNNQNEIKKESENENDSVTVTKIKSQ